MPALEDGSKAVPSVMRKEAFMPVLNDGSTTAPILCVEKPRIQPPPGVAAMGEGDRVLFKASRTWSMFFPARVRMLRDASVSSR